MKKIYSLLCSAMLIAAAMVSCTTDDSTDGDSSSSLNAPEVTNITAGATGFSFTVTAPSNSAKYGYAVVEGTDGDILSAEDIINKDVTSVKAIAIYESENLTYKTASITNCTPGVTYTIYTAASNSDGDYSTTGVYTATIISEEAPSVTLTSIEQSPYGFSYAITPSENTYKYAYATFYAGTPEPTAAQLFDSSYIDYSVFSEVTIISYSSQAGAYSGLTGGTDNTEFIIYAAAVTSAGTYSEVATLVTGTTELVTFPLDEGETIKDAVYNITYTAPEDAQSDIAGQPFQSRILKYTDLADTDGTLYTIYLLQAAWFGVTYDGESEYIEPYLIGFQYENTIRFDGYFAVEGVAGQDDGSGVSLEGLLYMAANDDGTDMGNIFGEIIATVDGKYLLFYGGGSFGMEPVVVTLDSKGYATDISSALLYLTDGTYGWTFDELLDAKMTWVRDMTADEYPAVYEEMYTSPAIPTRTGSILNMLNPTTPYRALHKAIK